MKKPLNLAVKTTFITFKLGFYLNLFIFCLLLLRPEISISQPVSTKIPSCISEFTGFSLKIPNNFEEVQQKIPGLVCSLRSKNSGYPTITVTLQPTPFSANYGKTFSESILESYKKVGLTDVKALSEESIESFIANSRLPKDSKVVALKYTLSGSSYNGLVLLINQPDYHIFVTFIESAHIDLELIKEAFRAIIGGIDGNFTDNETRADANNYVWIYIIGLLVLGSLVFYFKRK